MSRAPGRGGMVVRPTEWRDFQGVVDFYYTRYDEVATNRELFLDTLPVKPTLADEAEFFGGLMRGVLSGRVVSCVAEVDGKVVGLCSVYRKGMHNEDRHCGTLAIGLRPEYRGRGIGHELIGTVLRHCVGKFEVVYLTVVDGNEAARRLYVKHGFQECGRFPRAFQQDGKYRDDLLMWKALA